MCPGIAAPPDPETSQTELDLSTARLHKEYRETVFWAAYRVLLSTEDARDVVQDVFLRLPTIIGGFTGRGSLEGWIKRVALRTALMRRRKTRRLRETSLGACRRLIQPSFANRILNRLALEQAFASIPRPWVVVFVLKEVEGYTHEEIGTRLGIRPGTSKARLHHARKALQGVLGEANLYLGN